MKSKKALTLVIIFTLLASIFAMSDDGVNEPKVVKKEAIQETNVVSEQTEEAKSNTLVKDKLGFETGLTEKEFKAHQEAYIKRWIEFQESKEKEKNFKWKNEKLEKAVKAQRIEQALERYQQRVNINAIPEFKKFGIGPRDYFAGYHIEGLTPYTFATTMSPVVVHGKIIDMNNKYMKY